MIGLRISKGLFLVADMIGLNISEGLLLAELGREDQEKGENQEHRQEVIQIAKIQARGDGGLDYCMVCWQEVVGFQMY